MTVVKSLSKIAKIYNVENIGANDTTDEILDKIAGGMVFGSSNVTVAGATPSNKTYWGTAVSAMQSSIAVANGAITGTLHYLSSGQLVTDWGAGNFIALKFTKDNAKAVSIKVGLRPSKSGMPLLELDADMDGVFQITDKDKQVFVVRCTDADGNAFESIYDLSGLTLETED